MTRHPLSAQSHLHRTATWYMNWSTVFALTALATYGVAFLTLSRGSFAPLVIWVIGFTQWLISVYLRGKGKQYRSGRKN